MEIKADFLVLGSGIAGLTYALKVCTYGSVAIVTKKDKKESNPVGLVSSGLRMITTLSLVLGLIFLLFFGFKKYVLKNQKRSIK